MCSKYGEVQLPVLHLEAGIKETVEWLRPYEGSDGSDGGS